MSPQYPKERTDTVIKFSDTNSAITKETVPFPSYAQKNCVTSSTDDFSVERNIFFKNMSIVIKGECIFFTNHP